MAQIVCDKGRNLNKDKNNNSKINSNLDKMQKDFLYHLALGTDSHDLKKMFGDVKYICMGGKNSRMENFAQKTKEILQIELPSGADLVDLSLQSHRFCLYKVGPVLAVSHGMGLSSISICLHETLKLMHYAKMENAEFIRIGSSGGVGVEPGTVVIANGAVDGMLQTDYTIPVLGKLMTRPAILSSTLAQELENVGKTLPDIPVAVGKTMCASDFYEEQGRLDGAFCTFNNDDKMNYLKHLHENGVRNIEMESIPFAALTHQAGVRAAIVCVTLINRLVTDQVTTPVEKIHKFEDRPQELVLQYIKSKMAACKK